MHRPRRDRAPSAGPCKRGAVGAGAARKKARGVTGGGLFGATLTHDWLAGWAGWRGSPCLAPPAPKLEPAAQRASRNLYTCAWEWETRVGSGVSALGIGAHKAVGWGG